MNIRNSYPPIKTTRNDRLKKTQKQWVYAACVLVGLITRLIYCVIYPIPVRDAYRYKLFIEQWNNSNVIPEDGIYPPLAMYVLRVPSFFFHFEILKGGILVNIILGLCFIILTIRIAFLLKMRKSEALLCGLIIATHPTLVHYSCNLLREPIFLCFICLTMISIFQYYEKHQKRLIPLIAFYSACAYLCRHEGLELLIVCIVALVLKNTKTSLLIKVKDIFLYCGIFAVCFIGMSYIIGVPLGYYKSFFVEFHHVFSR